MVTRYLVLTISFIYLLFYLLLVFIYCTYVLMPQIGRLLSNAKSAAKRLVPTGETVI